jgi:hypothetical protein
VTLFVLPDGTKVEPIPDLIGIGAGVYVDHPTLGRILIDKDKLIEVPPSLPEEPPNGFVGRAGSRLWERDDAAEQRGDVGSGKHWWLMGDDQPYTWPVVNELNFDQPIVALRPDPSDDAPELPWFQKSEAAADVEDQVDITPTSRKVWIAWEPSAFTPDEAELRAAVILRAARDARRTQHNQGE